MQAWLCLLFLVTLLHSATVYGNIYNTEDFEKTQNVILRVNGPVTAQYFIKEGNYSVELPPGSYVLQAFFYDNGELKYTSYDQLVVGENEDSISFDIILLSPDTISLLYGVEVDDAIYGKNRNLVDEQANRQGIDAIAIFAVIVCLLLAVVISAYFFLQKNQKNAQTTQEPEGEAMPSMHDLGEDEKNVIRLLESNEGRMLQRELRQQLRFSETKMSLLLDELEVNKIIKRIKRGKGNIVKLLRRSENG